MYGTFPSHFQIATEPFVRDKRVLDVGCGDCERASALNRLGASVVGVDKERVSEGCSSLERFIRASFAEAKTKIENEKFDVAHLAWPWGTNHFAISLIESSPVIIYVGKNTGGTVCGTGDLFEYFRHRRVLLYLPATANVLIVYGKQCRYREWIHHEEHAGLWNAYTGIIGYDSTSELFRADNDTALEGG